jgi:hypothetical protein
VEFYVNKKVFGTPFHLYCKKDGTVEKIHQVPGNILDITSKKARNLSKLYNFTIPQFPPKKYKRSFYGLVDKDVEIPWHDVMPKDKYQSVVKNYINSLKDIFLNLNISYYENCYEKHNELFDSLQPAAINTNVFLMNCKKNHTVKSFVPTNGFSNRIVYDRTATTTGRLSVKKGPSILLVTKDLRRTLLKSKFGSNGHVYRFDYSELEPRVLLSFMGKTNIEQDIYSSLIKKLNVNIPRAAVKVAIISRLYGAHDGTIKAQLKELVDYPQDLIDLVDDFFEINAARNKVISEFYDEKKEILYNLYDRHIKFDNAEPYKILNYFVQSTAVDVALFGFLEIIKRLNKANTDAIIPLFILHDALIVDIRNDARHLIPKILKAGSINMPKFANQIFYMTSEQMV